MIEFVILLMIGYWVVACLVFILSGVQRWMVEGVDAWSRQAILLRALLSIFWLPAKIAHWVLHETWWE